jgi:hypothetical protein
MIKIKISFAFAAIVLAFVLISNSFANAARIVSVLTCENVRGSDFIPVGVSDNFNRDVESIHAVAVIEDVKPGTMIAGIWVSVDAIETPNYQIDSTSVKAISPDTRAHFALTRPTNGWPEGNYRLNLYIGGKYSTSVPFKIGKAGAVSQKARTPDPKKKGSLDLTGTWESQMQYGTSTLIIKPTGKIWLDGDSYDYKIIGNALRVTDEDGSQDYPFLLKGNSLSIDFAEGFRLQYSKVSDETKLPNGSIQTEDAESPQNYGNNYAQGGYSGGDADLMRHFAGTWWNATRNTETTVNLTADGRYYENYSASYSGSSRDQYGNENMNWGSAGDQGVQGSWTVQGTREQGTLTIIYQNGNQRAINYRVHAENGQVYWGEYYFNGELYGKK